MFNIFYKHFSGFLSVTVTAIFISSFLGIGTSNAIDLGLQNDNATSIENTTCVVVPAADAPLEVCTAAMGEEICTPVDAIEETEVCFETSCSEDLSFSTTEGASSFQPERSCDVVSQTAIVSLNAGCTVDLQLNGLGLLPPLPPLEAGESEQVEVCVSST